MISDTTCLSTFAGYPTTPTTPGGSQSMELIKSCVTLASLAPGASHKLSFYLNASTLGSRVVSCQLRYTAVASNGVSTLSSCAAQFTVNLVQPFSFSYTLYNKMLDESKVVHVDEDFAIAPKITCASPHNLVIVDSRYLLFIS